MTGNFAKLAIFDHKIQVIFNLEGYTRPNIKRNL